MKTVQFQRIGQISLLSLMAVLLAACSALSPAASQPTDIPIVSGNSDTRANDSANVIAEGTFLPRDTAWLAFGQPGLVAEVLVEESQQVAQGEVLARLDGREKIAAQLAAAELERLAAQQALDDLHEKAPLASSSARQALAVAEKTAIDARQALDDLDTDDFQQELDDARIAVEDAQDELDDAQEESDKYKELDKDNSTRKNAEDALEEAQQKYDDAVKERDLLVNQLEEAQANVAQAEAALDDARREAEDRQAGPDPDELALAQSRMDNASAQVTASQAALDDLELDAPFAGEILEVKIGVNERALPNEPLILLADRSAWYVETTDLTEMEVVRIVAGTAVTVRPDALPDLELSGTVERIAETYTEQSGDVLYTVRIRLDETDPRLRWGMTVEVEFQE